jgi:hypothetical protein
VGGKIFKSQKKKKLGAGRAENKVPKKKLRSGLRKGKQKNSTWDGTGIEKRILSMHHPSRLVHWWVLVHSGRHAGDEISKDKKKKYIRLQQGMKLNLATNLVLN